MVEITEIMEQGKKTYAEPVYKIKDKVKYKRKPKVKEPEPEQQMIKPPALALDPSMFKVTEQISPEQATAIIMQFMGEMDKIAMHSELTDDRIVNLMAIQSIGKEYDIPLLQSDIPNTLLPLLVSKDRKGREEIIKLIKAWSSGKQDQGLLARLKGGLF